MSFTTGQRQETTIKSLNRQGKIRNKLYYRVFFNETLK